MARQTRKAATSRKRRDRTPFGVLQLKMSLDAKTRAYLDAKDLIPRWINDEDHGERIRKALEGDYEYVTPNADVEVGSDVIGEDVKIKKLVGSHADGSPKYAYLMAIPREFYEEDHQTKEETNKLVDDAIRGGNPRGSKDHNIDPEKGRTYVKNVDYNP